MAVAAAVAAAISIAGIGPATGGTGRGAELAVPWERPLPPPSFAIRPPEDDPLRQRHTFRASLDGTELFVEAWLPAPLDGNTPPAKVPTVLSLQPYTDVGEQSGDHIAAVQTLVTRGYAYAQAHMRGTKGSGGCWDFHGAVDRSDVGDIIQFVAGAPWSDGNVGLYGISNPGGSALVAAGLADKTKTAGLRAVVAGAPVTSWYELFGRSGVPRFMPAAVEQAAGLFLWSSNGQISTLDNRPGERQTCWPDHVAGAAAFDGSFSDFVAAREVRAGAADITVPILVTHGFPDPDVPIAHQVGLFDQIPAATHKVALYGLFGHEWPDGDDWADMDAGHPEPLDQKLQPAPERTRADWQAMILAWFDQYLKGVDAGVGEWPAVQVQDNEGVWRAEDDWPLAGRRSGQLALGVGKLGAAAPVGSTTYTEASYRNSHLDGGYPPAMSARFEMDVPGRLEMAGQPVLDLWVQLDRPDAHIAATLDIYDENGKLLPYASTSGFRSAQHLDPYTGNRFSQRERRLPPIGAPVRVKVPFQPRDVVVPAGGKLVLTIAGSAPMYAGLETITGQEDGFYEPSQLSGTATRVTILHDCRWTSALRFEMPDDDRRLLNVREVTEVGKLHALAVRDEPSDAAGTASAAVCGKSAEPPRT